ncbi:MAG TPA: carboxylesterase family protein [Rhizomicrobium sp.]|nr:carboxylesterase family protein [Rhizomicrobium sp.]
MTFRIDRRRALLSSLAVAFAPPAFAADEAIATTANGQLRGLRDRGVSSFLGIPYGGSLSGAARFKAPPPAQSWTGIRDAIRLGAPSIQPPHQTYGLNEPLPAEDCLVLNVWTPATDSARRPVMFYMHGGGFTTGSGGSVAQDGANLAREYDVVVVESNHRLGMLGYLYLGQLLGPEYVANAGLLDLAAALVWVNTNIAAFGGDPYNVTILGESGGGAKSSALYAMPSAAPYFHKASIESALALGDNTPDRATEQTKKVLARLGIASSDAQRILDVPVERLLEVQVGDAPNLGPGTVPPPGKHIRHPGFEFGPVIDGTVLPERPFETHSPTISAAKPLIIGGCKNETVFFFRLDKKAFSLDEAGLRARLAPTLRGDTDTVIATFKRSRPEASPSDLFIAITTAVPWRAYAVHVAEQKAAEAKAPVYAYLLGYQSTSVVQGTDYRTGAMHASDIELLFDNAQLAPGQTPGLFNADQSAGRLMTAKHMSEMWANFARDGKPSAKGQPEWRPYTPPERATMILDSECRLENDPESAERAFWQRSGISGFEGHM